MIHFLNQKKENQYCGEKHTKVASFLKSYLSFCVSDKFWQIWGNFICEKHNSKFIPKQNSQVMFSKSKVFCTAISFLFSKLDKNAIWPTSE